MSERDQTRDALRQWELTRCPLCLHTHPDAACHWPYCRCGERP